MVAGSDAATAGLARRDAFHAAWAERRFPLLLPIVAPLTLLAAIVSVVNVVQTDTWVALVSGREIAHHGIPSIEHLTVSAHGHTWVDQQWLAQLGLYGIERVGGVGLVVAACTTAALGAFALAAAAAQQRGASPASLAIFVPGAFVAGPWVMQARTQSLALPLFALVLWLIVSDPELRRRLSLLLLAVLCVWANVHGSVTLGAAVVSVHALVALVRTGLRRLPLALLILAPLTVLSSPYAVDLPGYYRTMLLHPPYGRQIVEWQRTSPGNAPFFFAFAALTAVLLVVRRRRVDAATLVVTVTTFVAALSAVRLTPWFALAMLAVVPPILSRRAAGAEFRRLAPTAVAAVLLAVICAGLAWSGQRGYAGPRTVAAALQRAPRTMRVYPTIMLADWALWSAPTLRGRVAYDGRPELLTRKQFADVVRFARLSPGWREAVRGYSLLVTNDAIAQRLDGHGWRRIAAAQGIDVLRRSGATVRRHTD